MVNHVGGVREEGDKMDHKGGVREEGDMREEGLHGGP